MLSLSSALRSRLFIALLLLVGLSAQAVGAEKTGKEQRFWEKWNEAISRRINADLLATPDPWESWNRKVYVFNDYADRYLLTPVAKSYQTVTPDVVEKGVSNVFSNLLEVSTIVNDLLQFKFVQAASDTGRFVVNSTVGLVGLFDVATPLGLEKHSEDFGQTFGYWGMGPGPYVVMPLLGSYTLRDGFGAMGDTQLNLVTHIDHIPTRNQLLVLRAIDSRASLFSAEELITGDKYSFIRDAYLQRRKYLVKDGEVEDTFGEEDYEDNWDDAL